MTAGYLITVSIPGYLNSWSNLAISLGLPGSSWVDCG